MIGRRCPALPGGAHGFARQDRAVDAELKLIKRNARRRKTLDKMELRRRISECVITEERRLIDAVMLARALYALIASNDTRMGAILISESGNSPGLAHFNSIYKSIHGSKPPRAHYLPDENLIPFARAMYADHEAKVRAEVVAEMNAELQKRRPDESES
jgi:hypothetical protein